MLRDLDPIEEKIIQYVKDNPGKSKSDVVRFLKDRHIAARIATLNHIDKLESEKMIRCELENPNSQIYKIYVNEDNKLASVLTELEEFKNAYYTLLQKSKQIMDNKDYSVKALGITEADPTKWSQTDKDRYLKFEYDRFIEYDSNLMKLLEKYRKLDQLIHNGKLIRKSPQSYDVNHVKQYINEFSQYSKENSTIIKMVRDTSNSLRGGLYHMIYGPVVLFYAMADIIFHRSMLRWSKVVDREVLSEMYSVVYKKISELQLKLSEFIITVKLDIDFDKIMVGARNNRTFGLKILVDLYSDIGMKSEIQRTVNSLVKLNEEIKDLNLFGLDTIYHRSLEDDLLKSLDNGLKSIRELENMIRSRSDRIGSPEVIFTSASTDIDVSK